jgi:hypothetical protein
MKTDKIYKTGFNPNVNSYNRTSNESLFYETSSVKDCLSSITKNEQFIVEEHIYLTSDLIIDSSKLYLSE